MFARRSLKEIDAWFDAYRATNLRLFTYPCPTGLKMARKSTRRTRPHRPWNKGKSVGQKRPFTLEQVQLIKRTLDADGNLRDLALFSTAIDTMLRSVDVLRLTVEDVIDDAGHVVDEITIRQQKTGEANDTRKVLGRCPDSCTAACSVHGLQIGHSFASLARASSAG
jgi:integrase